MPPPAPSSAPAQPGVAPWWEERHREAEEREFWQLLERLDEKQRHEVIDTVKFQLWLQRWRNQERDLPSLQVIRGAVLAVTFDARMMLARFRF
jgi:hypothetical protein